MITQIVSGPREVIYNTFEGLNQEEEDQLFVKVAEVFLSRIGLKEVNKTKSQPLPATTPLFAKAMGAEIKKIKHQYPTKPFSIVFSTSTLDLNFVKIFKTLGLSFKNPHIPTYYRIQVVRSSPMKTFQIREDNLGHLLEEHSFSLKGKKNELDPSTDENPAPKSPRIEIEQNQS